MPQPTLGDVHVNRLLTSISAAYSQEAAGMEFVADHDRRSSCVPAACMEGVTCRSGEFGTAPIGLLPSA